MIFSGFAWFSDCRKGCAFNNLYNIIKKHSDNLRLFFIGVASDEAKYDFTQSNKICRFKD